MSSSFIIPKGSVSLLRNQRAQTPLARAFLEQLEGPKDQSDAFEITQRKLEKIVQGLGGYQCHPATEKVSLCSTREMEKGIKSRAERLYSSMVQIASMNSNSSIDTKEEVQRFSNLLNDRDEFLKVGGVQVQSEQKDRLLDLKVQASCADPGSIQNKFLKFGSFFSDLEQFVYRSKDVSLKYKVFRSVDIATISIDQFSPTNDFHRLYLLLFAQIPFRTFTYVVRLTYHDQGAEKLIQWEMIHNFPPSNRELERIVNSYFDNKKIHGANSLFNGLLPPIFEKMKTAFLKDEQNVKAKGTIKINSSTQTGISDIQYESDETVSSERVSAIASGILNFLLYTCNDPRVHSGKRIQAIPDLKIIADLPGLEAK